MESTALHLSMSALTRVKAKLCDRECDECQATHEQLFPHRIDRCLIPDALKAIALEFRKEAK